MEGRLIQAEQYFGARRMGEELKLRWVFWKESNPNTSCWGFPKAILSNSSKKTRDVFKIQNQSRKSNLTVTKVMNK